jgi:hypothetical protein
MTILIAAYNSSGCIGRCDAKCYNATSPNCDCICGGINHGVGQNKAMENANHLSKELLAAWNQNHPETTRVLVQLSFL